MFVRSVSRVSRSVSAASAVRARAVAAFSSSQPQQISSRARNGQEEGRHSSSSSSSSSSSFSFFALGFAAVSLTSAFALLDSGVDYDAVRKDIAALLEKKGYDDGNMGPVLVRLAWHAAGTYTKADGTGGSDGATMRFSPECNWGANAGLQVARDLLEPVKKKYGDKLSYADLWSLAGAVAIEELGGPKIVWRPGRVDFSDNSKCPKDGVLPDASQGADHLRAIFHRMGMTDKEIVALSGAHCLGRCHKDRSGFDGPWTFSPTVFNNHYFKMLLEEEWVKRDWKGPLQYQDKKTGQLMMLPSDLALLSDPVFKTYVKMYADDEETFNKDFASAFQKLQEQGVKAFQK